MAGGAHDDIGGFFIFQRKKRSVPLCFDPRSFPTAAVLRKWPLHRAGTLHDRILVVKYFGVVAEHQRAMSGLELVRGLVEGTLPLNTMAKTLGYDIIKVSKGCVIAAAEPYPGQLNPAGTVSRGLAATLLDGCMGLAVQSMLAKGFAQTTLEFKISFVRPITPETGLVKAEGNVITCGRRVGTAEGKLTDKAGSVLAHGTTTCLIFEHWSHNIGAACWKLISREEIMEIIRRQFIWLSGIAVAAPSGGNIVASQAHAQVGPKLTQILRQDLEGQDHTVQETVASILEFPTGSTAPWHMHPGAQELLHVIEGSLTVEIESRGKTLLKEGEAAIIPADLVHLVRNESTTAMGKALVVHSRAAKEKPLTVIKT
jgi:uncharacterized protein (TIGR00369 family)